MSICPISLISVENGVFLYNAQDCDNPGSTTTMSSGTALVTGCGPMNPDCLEGATARAEWGKTTLGMAASSQPVKRMVVPNDHHVHPKLSSAGISAKLHHAHAWGFPKHTADPDYEGEKSFHVVKIGGRDRFVRVFSGVVAPPPMLYILSYKGEHPRFTPLGEARFLIGQETELPEGMKSPRRMELAAKSKPGSCHVRLKRSGVKAGAPVFHVLLKK